MAKYVVLFPLEQIDYPKVSSRREAQGALVVENQLGEEFGMCRGFDSDGCSAKKSEKGYAPLYDDRLHGRDQIQG